MHICTCLTGRAADCLKLALTLRLVTCISRGLCIQYPLAYPDGRLGESNPLPFCQEADVLNTRPSRPQSSAYLRCVSEMRYKLTIVTVSELRVF